MCILDSSWNYVVQVFCIILHKWQLYYLLPTTGLFLTFKSVKVRLSHQLFIFRIRLIFVSVPLKKLISRVNSIEMLILESPHTFSVSTTRIFFFFFFFFQKNKSNKSFVSTSRIFRGLLFFCLFVFFVRRRPWIPAVKSSAAASSALCGVLLEPSPASSRPAWTLLGWCHWRRVFRTGPEQPEQPEPLAQ